MIRPWSKYYQCTLNSTSRSCNHTTIYSTNNLLASVTLDADSNIYPTFNTTLSGEAKRTLPILVAYSAGALIGIFLLITIVLIVLCFYYSSVKMVRWRLLNICWNRDYIILSYFHITVLVLISFYYHWKNYLHRAIFTTHRESVSELHWIQGRQIQLIVCWTDCTCQNQNKSTSWAVCYSKCT